MKTFYKQKKSTQTKESLCRVFTLLLALTFMFSTVAMAFPYAAEYEENITGGLGDDAQYQGHQVEIELDIEAENQPTIEAEEKPEGEPTFEQERELEDESIYEPDYELQASETTEYDVLSLTFGEPVGLQGFEGDFALGNSDEIVEIVVQFVTPPSVALRLMQERGMPLPRGRAAGGSFEEQALAAHETFMSQLEGITPAAPPGAMTPFAMPFEIFSEHYQLFNGVYMRVPAELVEQIAALPEVFAVTPHIIPVPPMPTSAAQTSGFFINDNLKRTLRTDLRIDEIHSTLNITGRGVRVAMLDTGIDSTHPEFERFRDGTGRVRGWEQHIERGYVYTDSNNHGTMTAGAIIAMAPEVELWSFRRIHTDNNITHAGLTAIGALEVAVSIEADIIYTWGGGTNPFQPEAAAVTLAVEAGHVVVAAAHNAGPNPFTMYGPANSPLAISVGAGTRGNDVAILETMSSNYWGWGSTYRHPTDTIARFSGRGPVMHTYHIKPDIIVTGVSSISTDSPGGGYGSFGGTSMASPVITGISALLMQEFPDAEPYEIKARIMNTARPLEGPHDGPNTGVHQTSVFSVGAGFVQPYEALTQAAFATVEHYVPVPLQTWADDDFPWPWEAGFSMQPRTMASLSFGVVIGTESSPIPITIRNAGSGVWAYEVIFNGNHTGVELEIEGSGDSFTAQMTFASNVVPGLYEGNLIFTNDDQRITMPFAANLQVSMITDIALPDGIVDISYFTWIGAENIPNGAEWRISSGALPPGLELSPNFWYDYHSGVTYYDYNSHRIEGIPTTPGVFSFQVAIYSDNLRIAYRDFTIRITTYGIISQWLPSGISNVPFREYVEAVNLPAGSTWAVLPGGTWPPGLNLAGLPGDVNRAVISGTPTTTGWFAFRIAVYNSSVRIAYRDLEIEIRDYGIITTELPDGEVGVPYSYQLQGINLPTSAVWRTGDLLPDGLSLNETGLISGTPTEYGDFSIWVYVLCGSSWNWLGGRSLNLHIRSQPLVAELGGTIIITGDAVFGETLTANHTLNSTPTIDNLGAVSYRWYRGITFIDGATNSTYTLVQADVGQTITVRVTTANTEGHVESIPTDEVTRRPTVREDLSYNLTTVTFNNTPRAVTVTGAVGLGAITVEYTLGGTTAWVTTAPTDAGIYSVRVIIAESDTHSEEEFVLGDFTIDPLSLTGAVITLSSTVFDYTNNAITPNVTSVVIDGINVPENAFIVSYSDNTSPGTGRVTVTAAPSGNFSGSESTTFTIVGSPIPASDISAPSINVMFNGAEHSVVVQDTGGAGVVAFRDANGEYTLPVSPTFVNAGVHTVHFRVVRPGTGFSPFYGSATVTITVRPISDTNVSISIPSQTFSGVALTPAPTVAAFAGSAVSGSNVTLAQGTHFTLSNWQNNTNAGEASVTITGIGNFSGTRIINFTIGQAAWPPLDFTFPTSASPITFGQTKSDSALTGGNVEFGTFAWTDPAYIPEAGTRDFSVTLSTNALARQNFDVSYTEVQYVELIVNRTSQLAPTIVGPSTVVHIESAAPPIFSATADGASTGALEWQSSNEDVATINADGEVTIIEAGSTHITVRRLGDGNHNDSPWSAPVVLRIFLTQYDADIAAAVATIEGATYAALQANVINMPQARAAVEAIIAGLSLSDDIEITIVNGPFTAAIAGTQANLSGTNGSFTFTVNVAIESGGAEPRTTRLLTLTITATPATPLQLPPPPPPPPLPDPTPIPEPPLPPPRLPVNPAGSWRQDANGNWRFTLDSGGTLRGWAQIGGEHFFFNNIGIMQTGWVLYSGTWYYLRGSGAMATGWIEWRGDWYYLRRSGAMATGWIEWNSSWYYLRGSGAMATGWVQSGEMWYYLQSDGAMATGWVRWNGDWYYLRGDGAMATGWVQSGGLWYYLQADGAMARGGVRAAGNERHRFAASGRWLGRA
ncbi:MAG: S8 family serine peptidase [Oscillospiraceae bacterium]|nr:S8 family serine peptidase [Oscillospiraceae bacterium]